jgi:uncharacterized protein (DUF169 family)
MSGRVAKEELYEKQSNRLREVLELDGSPVAVSIVHDTPWQMEKIRRKLTACMMVQIARNGASFYCSGNSLICGGRSNLGMGELTARKLDDFLVYVEKLFLSKTAARRLIEAGRKMAPNKGNYMIFSPLADASFTPDVVLFVGTPEQVSRIMFLDAFESGQMDTVHGEPLCSGAIASPITTGKIGVSFLDMSCRFMGGYRPEEMVIGVPYYKMRNLVDNIDLSSAGIAKPGLVLTTALKWLRKRMSDNLHLENRRNSTNGVLS